MTEPIIISPESEPFWQAAAEGRLVIQHCSSCDVNFFSPRAFCPECMSPDLEWIECSGRATVYSYTIVHRGAGITGESPYVLALVDLEEGPRMMTNIVDCEHDQLAVDMPVRVKFGPKVDDRAYPLFVPA